MVKDGSANVTPKQTRVWTPFTAAQGRALGRICGKKDAPNGFVTARGDEGEMIVVPASSKDRRRWDISKGGKVSRKER